MIIYTCPECGHDLENEELTCYPPIHIYVCPNCGWSHSEQEEVVRIPFGGNRLNTTTKLITILNTPMQPSDAMYESSACIHCTNNPKNGGSGICNCILGLQEFKC